MSQTDPRPIGVFDSGVGGLSILRAAVAELPAESFLYVADSGHAPYGDRLPDFIEERAFAITSFLRARDVKAIVVACNTVTGVAVAKLRAHHALPIIAVEPAIKPAARGSRSGVVGVLGTTRTLASDNVALLRARFGTSVRLLLQACPGLVERVEAGELDAPGTRAAVERYVEPLLAAGADTLVLACTHYPFLGPLIAAIAGPGVDIIDPSPAVARELRRRLAAECLLAEPGPRVLRFFTSGEPGALCAIAGQLIGTAPAVEPLPAV